jgi:hypothetical protein
MCLILIRYLHTGMRDNSLLVCGTQTIKAREEDPARIKCSIKQNTGLQSQKATNHRNTGVGCTWLDV